jgi:hypothetical protein
VVRGEEMEKMVIAAVSVLFLTIFLALANGQDPTDDPLVVRTTKGYLKGSILTSRKGKSIYSFRGVRFAQPPVGNRRFKVRNWNASGQRSVPHKKKERLPRLLLYKATCHILPTRQHVYDHKSSEFKNLRILTNT